MADTPAHNVIDLMQRLQDSLAAAACKCGHRRDEHGRIFGFCGACKCAGFTKATSERPHAHD